MDQFSIRPGTEDDVPRVLQFIRELAEYEKLSHEVTATEEQLHVALFGVARRAEILLPCVDGIPVGFALFFHNFSTFLGKPGLYVEDLFIQPAFRGKGYARALMIQLARIARDRGCGRFEWAVLDWNKSAIEFYRSLGATSMTDWTIQRVTGTALDALADRPLRDRDI